MNNSINKLDDFDLIERFFDFDLSPIELKQFEQRMETDAAFRKRFQLFKEMDTHIEKRLGASEEMELIKQQFKSTIPIGTNNKNVLKKNTGKVISLRKRLSIAATIALIIVSMVILRMVLQPNDPNTLAMEYWEQTTSITFSNQRSDNTLSITEEQLIKASELLENQNYPAVIQSLVDIDTNDAQYLKVSLLLGQAYFNQKQLDFAESEFQMILNHPSGDYRDSALWFQALTQLAKGNKQACKANLKEIIQQNYLQASKAKSLLTQIK